MHAVGLDCAWSTSTSTDDTAAHAAAAGARVLRLPVNLGVAAALRTGFRYAVDARIDTVIQCDGDGQHPPEEIPGLLAAADVLTWLSAVGSSARRASIGAIAAS